MHIEVKWYDDEKRIIMMIFKTGWSVDEFYVAYQTINAMLREVKYTFDGFIIDNSEQVYPPPSTLSAFRQALTAGFHPMVFIRPNPATRMLVDTVVKVYRVKRPIYYADGMTDALAFIEENKLTSAS
jgi:hypothetical protein